MIKKNSYSLTARSRRLRTKQLVGSFKWSSRLKNLTRGFLVASMAFVAFITMNGFGETLSPWSQATLNLLSAAFYKTEGRDKITVLLFRERDLATLSGIGHDNNKKTKLPYPLPYSVHVEMLEALDARKPRAVFIDFAFSDVRAGDDVQDLIRVLCEMQAHGTTVSLAAFDYWQPRHGVRDEIYERSKSRSPDDGCYSIVPVGYESEDNGYVHTYNLIQKSPHAANESAASAALHLYRHYTLGDGSKASSSASTTNGFDAPLDIVWGASAPDNKYSDAPCEAFSLIKAVGALIKNGPQAAIRECPYNNTLSAYSLFMETGEEVDRLVRDKVVLYGGAFHGTGDWLLSPAHGNVPGVYLHAMALDNILTYEGNYKRITERFKGDGYDIASLVDVLIILFGVTWAMLVQSQQKSERPATAWSKSPRGGQRIDYLRLLSFSSYATLGVIILLSTYFQYRAATVQLVGATLVMYLLYRSWVHASRRKQFHYKSRAFAQRSLDSVTDFLYQKTWVAVALIVCILSFVFLDYGSRNFWALVLFIDIALKVDTWVASLLKKDMAGNVA